MVSVPLGLIAGICHLTMAEAEKSVYILHMIIFNRFDHFGDDVITFEFLVLAVCPLWVSSSKAYLVGLPQGSRSRRGILRSFS